ncbi:hypothetical protein HGRIS_014762 [Hohenbuehelia grisea]|uniref:BTB domain-containing protein n=1 Tax=Hohenbuehelia grisea TaxID=104357 RepID=A0ABR3IQN7_9AGAR
MASIREHEANLPLPGSYNPDRGLIKFFVRLISAPVPVHAMSVIQEAQPSAFTPEEPFNSDTGDVVFRTSDGARFHLHKIILSLASPHFDAMFSLPPPPSSSSFRSDEIPSDDIVVPEDGKTLDLVLRFCYPVDEPPIDDLMLAISALAAAAKYELTSAEKYLRRIVHKQIEEHTDPLSIFGRCCKLRLENEARLAARQFLKYPILANGEQAGLEDITARGYHNLLRYHRQCADRTTSVLVNDALWLQPLVISAANSEFCDGCKPTGCSWIQDYLSAARAIVSSTPGKNYFLQPTFVHNFLPICHEKVPTSSWDTTFCGDKTSHFLPLLQDLAQEINRSIDEVELILDI